MMIKVNLCMQDGKEITTEVTEFNVSEVVERLNDRTTEYISIGNVGVAKYAIRYFTTEVIETI